SCEKIKRTNGALRNWPELCRQLDELRASMSIDGAAPIRAKIKEIVPEYCFEIDKLKQNGDQSLAARHFRAVAGND
ncbi:MAG TPA: hypothetical protein VER98_10925, partial [Terriglobia bacterium]|nr:hypothetical protein [Terriglobia bacterium]